jgi:hypothetical protein
MGSSPASSLSGNPGLAANASSQVHEAVKLLQIALPNLPIGTPPHAAVVKAVDALAKAFPAAEQQPGVQATALRDLQHNSQQQAPLMALMRQMGGGQGDGGAGMPPAGGQAQGAGPMPGMPG